MTVFLNILDMGDKKIGKPDYFPPFIPEKHAGFCNELKQLYVSITRTRQTLIIVDDDELVWHFNVLVHFIHNDSDILTHVGILDCATSCGG